MYIPIPYMYIYNKISLQAAYIAVMRNSSRENRTGFDALLKLYREVDGIQEKERILRKIEHTLDSSMNENPFFITKCISTLCRITCIFC